MEWVTGFLSGFYCDACDQQKKEELIPLSQSLSGWSPAVQTVRGPWVQDCKLARVAVYWCGIFHLGTVLNAKAPLTTSKANSTEKSERDDERDTPQTTEGAR